jgi:hypothetical protein
MSSEFREKRYDYILRLWGHFTRRWEPIILALILLALSVVWLPEAMVNRSYRGDQQRSIASGNNYAKLVDDYRKTLVQIIGGAFLLYGLYLTHRRTKATEETLRTTQESLKVTRETQITDRFTKAITQLGATDSQGRKQIETRLGAIYSLERIAKDSPVDHWSIMEILTAYVRENAPGREPRENEDPQALASDEIPQLAKDVAAIMTVIGRGGPRRGGPRRGGPRRGGPRRGGPLLGGGPQRDYWLNADPDRCCIRRLHNEAAAGHHATKIMGGRRAPDGSGP